MTTKQLCKFLEEIGFKLIGSRAIGKAKEDSDYDYATTDDFIYKKTLEILKNKKDIKFYEKDIVEPEFVGSAIVGYRKIGTKPLFYHPISDEGDIFDLHLVDKILPKNKQLLLHYEKYGI